VAELPKCLRFRVLVGNNDCGLARGNIDCLDGQGNAVGLVEGAPVVGQHLADVALDGHQERVAGEGGQGVPVARIGGDAESKAIGNRAELILRPVARGVPNRLAQNHNIRVPICHPKMGDGGDARGVVGRIGFVDPTAQRSGQAGVVRTD